MSDETAPFHFFHPHRVRYSEVDPQAIVFNSRYMEFVDEAGTEYFRALGFPPLELASVQQFDMVVVHAEMEFRAAARLDDLLHIYVRTARIGRTSLTSRFEIRRATDGALLNRATIKYVNVDLASGKAVPVPETVRRAVEALEGLAVTA
ncbi:MAG: thioesterase family protein [Anaerolineae bacterium]